ncbi:MAG: ShlB/FhaC/HecB family hemolysin secretion/activation protein [Rhodoferax sp.]|uniref:ShlB/FhaC/HecB family hemolysin secretion/activation protein n=1 Tax=Rhodoferax sp. TaxID=50421 RepID=UPI002721655C|nr:ShlB/FhaC/HecB family hemolysin secretion/activation protein [Rhodoferax sp.]MDO8450816.1 ShlB/FhaC/HecB family hemolysin secretion/activation protein [Rhodoferax sp.]
MRNALSALCLLAGAFLCAAPALAQDAKFDVFEYRVEGTTLLPTAAVERAVYPHMGEQKTLADVEKAREALEKAYHASGYLTVLVTIPQQKVNDGLVKLAVTEAPVDRLRVVESRYFLPSDIKAGVPELAEGNVPNFQDMQTELAALNRSPDRRITPVLRPGKTPGTVEVDLKVQDELPLHGNVELNDRYSQDTSHTRLSASMRWDNLWNKQHSLGLTMQTSPSDPKESKVFSANYTVPLSGGDFLALYGVKSDSDVSAVGTLSVVGRGTILGMRYIRPLPGSETFFHSASFGVDYKDFDQSVELIDSGGFNTPIKYLPFTMGWDATWLKEGSTSKLGLSFNFHLQGMVGNEREFADKRFKGRPSYAYLRGNASQQWKLPQAYGLNARASWQLAGQPLVSNEQFAIGGVDTVRGYLESAAMGDRGLALSLEAKTPNLAARFPSLGDSVTDLHALAFIDAANVRVIDPISATDRFTLAGVGLGLSLKGWGGLDVSLNWAYPLKAVGNTRSGDHRFHFNVAYGW